MKTKYEHFKATFGTRPFLPEMRANEHEPAGNPAGLDPVGIDSAVRAVDPAEHDSVGIDGTVPRERVRTLMDEIM